MSEAWQIIIAWVLTLSITLYGYKRIIDLGKWVATTIVKNEQEANK